MIAFLHPSRFCASFGSSGCCFKSLRTRSIHLSLGLPRGLPPTFVVVSCFPTFVSSPPIAWLYHEKAFLRDIFGDLLDHCIAPELFFSDSIFPCFCPESILAFSSRLCASFAALLCVAPNTHCHISKLL